MKLSRRDVLVSATAGALGIGCASVPKQASGLLLTDFQPRSMLKVPEHPTPRARFPAIDVHTHISWGGDDGGLPSAVQLQQILGWMKDLNIQTMVNLTGGWGDNLDRTLAALDQREKGRFLTCTEPAWQRANDPDYPNWQADELKRAKSVGAHGLKVLKTLGLYLRTSAGKLIAVDDPRFDPMWETAGGQNLPVFIHTSDPDAFFTPTDRFNERWEELGNNPAWSFHGKDFPSKAELLAQRNRVIEKHPGTHFVCLHVANHPEDLDEVSALLHRYPNTSVEIGARLGELGRQPRRARQFFEEFPERIMFGTDATPGGEANPQQDLKRAMFQSYFRFLETLDEHFDYAGAAPTPPQGRWKIYGIGLPDDILRRVYHDNAAALLGLPELQ